MVSSSTIMYLRSLLSPISLWAKFATRTAFISSGPFPHKVFRSQSTLSSSEVPNHAPAAASRPVARTTSSNEPFAAPARPLARLPLTALLRSLLLSSLYTRPFLLRPLMALLNSILHSKTPLLNLSNPILYAIVRSTVYDHFNAGTTPVEVQRMISKIKKVGYQGVILGHAREIEQTEDPGPGVDSCPDEVWISKWLDLNLETLALVGRGDYLNVKLSGAGRAVTAGLATNSPPSEQTMAALDKIIKKARDQGSRVWIDAEKQDVQEAIDKIVINLMRKYNRTPDSGGGPLVWNTIQAYLKSSRQNLERHVNIAREEGWILGIKLVRGAYITTEDRIKIWETKEGTDGNYNAIVNDIVRGKVNGMKVNAAKGITPKIWLFAAGHNTESIRKASAAIQQLNDEGKPCPPVGFAQLQGMADEVSCGLLCEREEMLETANLVTSMMVPEVHKCLSWGPVDECMGFLLRRTVENAGAADRIKEGTGVIGKELRRRILRF